MPVTINPKFPPAVEPPVESVAPKKRGHTVPVYPTNIPLDKPGRLRTCHIQALLGNISDSAVKRRINKGHFPVADGNDGKPYWNTATVRLHLGK